MEASEIFLSSCRKQGAPLQVVGYDEGIHGFDTDQDSEESRRVVAQTLQFLRASLAK